MLEKIESWWWAKQKGGKGKKKKNVCGTKKNQVVETFDYLGYFQIHNNKDIEHVKIGIPKVRVGQR